jgi:hypothetical protein
MSVDAYCTNLRERERERDREIELERVQGSAYRRWEVNGRRKAGVGYL